MASPFYFVSITVYNLDTRFAEIKNKILLRTNFVLKSLKDIFLSPARLIYDAVQGPICCNWRTNKYKFIKEVIVARKHFAFLNVSKYTKIHETYFVVENFFLMNSQDVTKPKRSLFIDGDESWLCFLKNRKSCKIIHFALFHHLSQI